MNFYSRKKNNCEVVNCNSEVYSKGCDIPIEQDDKGFNVNALKHGTRMV